MAATEGAGGAKEGAFAALMKAALALPVLVVPMRAGAVDTGEVGFSVLGYKERGLMKITEPVLWGRVAFGDGWDVRASVLVDIVTGASPQLVTNQGGQPVQSLTGASVSDRRHGADVKVARRLGDFTLGASRTISDEDDYRSRAYGLEATWDANAKLTTFAAGYGKSNDRVRSSDDPSLDAPRVTEEYLLGVTQVLSRFAVVQSTLTVARGKGYYNDPYKLTLSFPPDGSFPLLTADVRPPERDTFAWLTRYRHHFAGARGTLQADYRFYRDDWGIRAHTLEVAWTQDLDASWSLRPALRYYTQSAADFYSPVTLPPVPAAHSSDQRLAAFGGLSPSLRAIWRGDDFTIEGTIGYYHNASNLRLGGGGSSAFETLRAAYILASILKTW